jgi:hypothetical protein
MNQYPDLVKAIEDNKMPLARSILIGLANRSIDRAVNALEYIQSISHSIFEPHDEALYPINPDVTAWNEDYWHGVTSDLMHNFSLNRFKHLLDVARAIRSKPENITIKEGSIDPNLKPKLDKLIMVGNLPRLRSEIIGIANTDIKEALSAFKYALDKKTDLLQEHDEVNYPIDGNEDSWDNDYWHGLISDMMHNFSEERFEHMLRVRQYLVKEDVQVTTPQEEHAHPNRQGGNPTEDMEKKDNTLTYILIAAGIVIAVPIVLWLLLKS